MTVINHKSISGVTSITAPAGSDNLFTVHTNDTTERFRIDASGHQNISGIITASNFKTGTTNVHNVGVELAGINVLGADTPIGTGATIYNSGSAVFTGVVTATSFVGGLTGTSGSFSSSLDIADKIRHVGDTNTFMKFDTDTVTFETAGDERLRIDNGGNVVIGHTSAGNKLQVGNTGHSGYALATISGTYGTVLQVGEGTTPTTAAALWVRNLNNGGTATSLFRVNGNGVCIAGNSSTYDGGGTLPNLYVRGTGGRQVKIHNPNAATCSLQLSNATTGQGEDGGFQLAQLGGGDFYFDHQLQAKDVVFRTKPSGGSLKERLRIDSSGNITAVNSTSGATTGVTLKVGASAASGTNSGTVIINNGGLGNASLQFDYEGSAARAKIYTYRSTNDIIFDTSGTEKYRFKDTGEFHISDRNSANTGEHIFQAGAFGIRMQDTGGYNRWNIERNYGGFQSTPIVHLSAQGRVGINESAPDHMFHIKGTSTDNNPVLAVESSSWASGKSAALRLSYTDGNAREIRGHYDHGLQFFINTGEAMRINTSGRIIFGPDATDIQLIPHSTNSGHGQLYFRGNASNESSSIKLNHYGHADYVIGVGRHSNGMFSITRSDTGTDGLLMNNSGKVSIGKAPETLTGNGVNAKLQVNTGAADDYSGIMIGGGYTRSTIQNGATYDLILTSNAYPANATSKGIRFKCGTSGGGGPHERMRIHQSGMSEWRQHGGSKTYEYRSSVTGSYNQCIIIADCHAYHSFAIEVDISGYAYKYVWGKYYGYENGSLYNSGAPGHQDRYSSSQYITHSHDGGHKHKFLCYISSATHPQCGIKITVGGPDAYIDDGDITFAWS